MAEVDKDRAHLGLVQLGWVPLDRDAALVAAHRKDPVALLERLLERVVVLDSAHRLFELEFLGYASSAWRCLDDAGGVHDHGRREVRDLLAAELSGRGVDGGEDLRVLATPADVAGEAFGDLRRRRLRDRPEQLDRRHDESARADAALESTVEPERALD